MCLFSTYFQLVLTEHIICELILIDKTKSSTVSKLKCNFNLSAPQALLHFILQDNINISTPIKASAVLMDKKCTLTFLDARLFSIFNARRIVALIKFLINISCNIYFLFLFSSFVIIFKPRKANLSTDFKVHSLAFTVNTGLWYFWKPSFLDDIKRNLNKKAITIILSIVHM